MAGIVNGRYPSFLFYFHFCFFNWFFKRFHAFFAKIGLEKSIRSTWYQCNISIDCHKHTIVRRTILLEWTKVKIHYSSKKILGGIVIGFDFNLISAHNLFSSSPVCLSDRIDPFGLLYKFRIFGSQKSIYTKSPFLGIHSRYCV